VLDPLTGGIMKIEIIGENTQDQTRAFQTYQALAEEINRFGQRTKRLVFLNKITGGQGENEMRRTR
ncbi:MAG: hypothetical protein DRN90_00675, partial [Thermoproteota archaeon]